MRSRRYVNFRQVMLEELQRLNFAATSISSYLHSHQQSETEGAVVHKEPFQDVGVSPQMHRLH
jgi:hypothetical protein